MSPFVAAELTRIGARVLAVAEDAVPFEFRGPWRSLAGLKRCTAVYAVLRFDVPRPKALLGHEHLTRLTTFLEELTRSSAAEEFRGFRFGAAGSDSQAFARLAEVLSQRLGMAYRPEEGELLLRVRPSQQGGWEVLARLTPRPLSARAWRQCNRPGGLNASVAAAAHDVLGVDSSDSYLNLMCGSGTLLIERALVGPWLRGVGVDLDASAVACSAQNVAAAGLERRVDLLEADATQLPYDAANFDRITVDLPWGDAVGDHRENARLYPPLLAEAARVASPRARMVAITHELRLFEAALAGQSEWVTRNAVRVFHGGHRPAIYLLRRRRQ